MDIDKLRESLATGPHTTRLNPDEIDELEEAGFIIETDWTDAIDNDGRRECTVHNRGN